MAPKTFDTEFVCTVLQEHHLLNEEQIQYIQIQEEKHRKLLQAKLTKEGKNGSGKSSSSEQGGDQITIVDVINSMRLRLPADKINEYVLGGAACFAFPWSSLFVSAVGLHLLG